MTAGKILIIAAGYAAVAISFAQTTRPAFEVASIRPSKTNESWFWEVTPGGRLVCRSCTLKRLIVLAYRVQEVQVVGGPTWASKDQFDIEAKPDTISNSTDAIPPDAAKPLGGAVSSAAPNGNQEWANVCSHCCQKWSSALSR